VSARQDSPLIIGGAAVIVASVGANYVLNLYKNHQAAEKFDAEAAEDAKADGEDAMHKSTAAHVDGDDTEREKTPEELEEEAAAKARAASREARARSREARQKEREEAKKSGAKKPSFFDDFMTDMTTQMGYGKNYWAERKAGFFAKNFYDGGFDDKMTKREAALILGVRENTSTERIKVQHRKILLINHPDRGGSPYVAAKINEAKDLLLKGKGK
jgi:hypothetical protein